MFRLDARKKLARSLPRTIFQRRSKASVHDIEASLSVDLSDSHVQDITTGRNFFHVRNSLLSTLATRLVCTNKAEDIRTSYKLYLLIRDRSLLFRKIHCNFGDSIIIDTSKLLRSVKVSLV